MKRKDALIAGAGQGLQPGPLARLRRAAKRRAHALRRDEDGATAIEFAVVALVFFSLIFAILELAIIFFINAVLSHTVVDAGRDIRLGRFANCGGAAEFKALVCSRMKNLMNCEANLRVDVATASGFRTIIMPPRQGSPEDPNDPLVVDDGTFMPGIAETPGIPVNIRATFYYKNVLPTRASGVGTTGAGDRVYTTLEPSPRGYHVIQATTAFRSEPFDPGGTCDPGLDNEINPPPPNGNGG